ncbi:MAG: hypothetical protein JNL70_02715 [Saprospiraceae bacterium]|nr:hypothetical protein [Saprospiraceae bacterium]
MKNISRKTFLKQSFAAGSLLVLHPQFLFSQNQIETDTEFYKKTVAANAKAVEALLTKFSKPIEDLVRQLGYDFANLVAAFAEPQSKFYQNKALIPHMESVMRFLVQEQNPDGTLDIANFASPPDTAFILEPIAAAAVILEKIKSKELETVKNLTKTFILKVGDALTVGGIHTENHRWVVSAGLAQVHHLYPNKKYLNRIEEWVAEGIYVSSEGHHLERSMIYSEVVDRALILMARLLNRPQYLAFVRKNLDMIPFYTEPNGDMVTVDSRRQDQYRVWNCLLYYLPYRYMAIADKNGYYAAMAHFIEKTAGFEEKVREQSLIFLLEEPLLKEQLPSPLPLKTEYERFFKETQLVRFRKGDLTASIFGGTDKPLIIASGRSSNPNFFSMRKGEAELKHVRFSTNFFSTGYFRSEGIEKIGEAYVLKQTLKVPYYQPLPANKHRKDASYKLSESVDHRFWNTMDFENRPLSNVQVLETKIVIQKKNDGFELQFDVQGTEGVEVVIELCFKEGGQLSDMKTFDSQPQNYFLQSGTGVYTFGKDTINVGNGIYAHNRLRSIDGEVYSTHFGTLRQSGLNVYLTGKTPFKHVLVIV